MNMTRWLVVGPIKRWSGRRRWVGGCAAPDADGGVRISCSRLPNKNALRSHTGDEEQRGCFVVPPTFAGWDDIRFIRPRCVG